MTKEELAALDAKWEDPPRYHGDDYERLADEASADVAALIREVRRLRGLLTPLVAQEPGLTGGTYLQRMCGYCYMLDYHDTDCPWALARAALSK